MKVMKTLTVINEIIWQVPQVSLSRLTHSNEHDYINHDLLNNGWVYIIPKLETMHVTVKHNVLTPTFWRFCCHLQFLLQSEIGYDTAIHKVYIFQSSQLCQMVTTLLKQVASRWLSPITWIHFNHIYI